MTVPVKQLQQLRHDVSTQFRESGEAIDGFLHVLLCGDYVVLLRIGGAR